MDKIWIKRYMDFNYSNFVYVGHLKKFISDKSTIVGIYSFRGIFGLMDFYKERNSFYIYDIVIFETEYRIIYLKYNKFYLFMNIILFDKNLLYILYFIFLFIFIIHIYQIFLSFFF